MRAGHPRRAWPGNLAIVLLGAMAGVLIAGTVATPLTGWDLGMTVTTLLGDDDGAAANPATASSDPTASTGAPAPPSAAPSSTPTGPVIIGPTLTGPTAAPGDTAEIRLLPLGDSITAGCWRSVVAKALTADGWDQVNFVGSQSGPSMCGSGYDDDHEGHSGYSVTSMIRLGQIKSWLKAARPDVITVHLGTNDIAGKVSTEKILAAYTTLVEQARAVNPRVQLVVAQIIPLDKRSCSDCIERTADLDAAIPQWAAGLSTAASPIQVVDMATGWDPDEDTSDGIHPTHPGGTTKMAQRWLPAIEAALRGTGAP